MGASTCAGTAESECCPTRSLLTDVALAALGATQQNASLSARYRVQACMGGHFSDSPASSRHSRDSPRHRSATLSRHARKNAMALCGSKA
jgi:hypothetical protein